MNLKQGSLLKNGEYRIEMVLGQGGFGITYLATHVSLDDKVAIKEFFMKELCNRDEENSEVSVGSIGSMEQVERHRQKFIKEARNIRKLKHRNIVPVIDVFEENGTAYYVMEYFGGGSLADKVKCGPIPEAEALHYIRQVADALEFIHSRKVMHLDVKPGNVLVDEAGNAVLIDFGISKQYDGYGGQTSTTPVGVSPGYAPSEQYMMGGVGLFSPATDIYSLGATLYKLVTGLTPPEANYVDDEGLPSLPTTLSPAVCRAIEAAMQPRRKERPQSIGEFLEILFPSSPVLKDSETEEAIQGEVLQEYEEDAVAVATPVGEDTVAPISAMEETIATVEPIPSATTGHVPSQKPVRKSSKAPWIIAACVAVVTLIAVLLLSGGDESGVGNDATVAEDKTIEANNYFESAIAALDEGDMEKMFEYGLKSAKLGNSDAAYLVACCYDEGVGTDKSEKEALFWLESSSDAGNAEALNLLAAWYDNGYIVEKSAEKAFKLYKSAAAKGSAEGQCNLACCYIEGVVTEESPEDAIYWLKEAVAQDYAHAQYMYGLCFYYGYGVDESETEGEKWLRKAAEQGHEDAIKTLEEFNSASYTNDYDFDFSDMMNMSQSSK